MESLLLKNGLIIPLNNPLKDSTFNFNIKKYKSIKKLSYNKFKNEVSSKYENKYSYENYFKSLNELSFLSQRRKYKENNNGLSLPLRPYRNIMNPTNKRISNIILEDGSSIPILTKQVQHIYDV